MKAGKRKPILITFLLALGYCGFLVCHNVVASFYFNAPQPHIYIDGIHYGPAGEISGLENLVRQQNLRASDSLSGTVEIDRELLTENSLYVWAEENNYNFQTRKKFEIKYLNDNHDIQYSIVLKNPQPLSWNLERPQLQQAKVRESVRLYVQYAELIEIKGKNDSIDANIEKPENTYFNSELEFKHTENGNSPIENASNN